jgi:hypothetical protein
MSSHLGINPEDHVVLSLSSSDSPTGAWERVFPDATSEFPFLIPEGRFLIITDLDWQFQLAADEVRIQNVTLRLFVAPWDDLTASFCVHSSTALLDDQGYGGTSEAMTAGFVVDDAATIMWDAIPVANTVTNILLRGYLVDRQ